MGGHSQAPAAESCLLNASHLPQISHLVLYFDIIFSLSNAWIFSVYLYLAFSLYNNIWTLKEE